MLLIKISKFVYITKQLNTKILSRNSAQRQSGGKSGHPEQPDEKVPAAVQDPLPHAADQLQVPGQGDQQQVQGATYRRGPVARAEGSGGRRFQHLRAVQQQPGSLY